ncbi:unnamed protein product [Gongylonema pulchrum]|uniref:Uncharacterized protein n=1 Tax=Gongylonema pulchrum TaxID=637853 RepID=A0A3P7S5H2_9BILA|nr:unnamed protein product [Gongylonema pulchrum]
MLKMMLEAKSVFDELDVRDLRDARTRANPYETIGSAFFQNRYCFRVFSKNFQKKSATLCPA